MIAQAYARPLRGLSACVTRRVQPSVELRGLAAPRESNRANRARPDQRVGVGAFLLRKVPINHEGRVIQASLHQIRVHVVTLSCLDAGLQIDFDAHNRLLSFAHGLVPSL